MTPARAVVSSETRDDAGFGIYVHWPFCAQKCPYCDFNSHVRFQGWDEARFLEAYKRELKTFAAHVPQNNVSSIFFGGGTPSLMKGETVGALLDHIATLWTIAPDAEITLEANPGSVEAGRFQDYRTAGVNRVSIGVQALIDADLKALGRIHSVAESRAAVAIAERTFDRFSFDLIYARSGQTPDAWRSELQDALAIAGEHLSLYQLTIEDGTPFADLYQKGRLQIPDEDAALALYAITQDLTAKAGLPAYEISNHARPGGESQHNLIYWRYGSYVGVGPGAHGRVSWDNQRQATVTEPNPEAWCRLVEDGGDGITQRDGVGRDAQGDEFLMMGLRLSEGVDVAKYTELCGRNLNGAVIADLANEGFVEFEHYDFSTLTSVSAAHGDEDRQLFGGELSACLGPGLQPATDRHQSSKGQTDLPKGRLRVTAKGRFVLNQIVYQLASSTQSDDGRTVPERSTVAHGSQV